METTKRRQLEEFIAQFVNTPSSALNETQVRESLIVKLSQIMVLPWAWQRFKRDAEDEEYDQEDPAEKERTKEEIREMERVRAERALEPFHTHAERVIGGLLTGYLSVSLGVVEVFGQLTSDRRLKEKVLPPEEGRPGSFYTGDYILPLYSTLLQVLQRRPFPFGRCERKGCGKIFVQPVRGKPRRYCSTACRLQSSPAVARHTAYVRELRQKRRKTEIATTRAILRQWPDQEGYVRELGKRFPQKSRRQLLYLVKQAGGAVKTKRKETA